MRCLPARLCLCIATLTTTTMMIVGGARGASLDLFLATKSTTGVEHGDILRLFFEELVRVMNNDKWHPRHATIVSRSRKDGDDATPFCEHYSCFTGDKLNKFVDVRGFSQENLVVLFNHNLKSDLKDIQSCSGCRIMVVTRKAVSRKRITAYCNRHDAKKILFLTFVVVDGPTVKFYAPKSTGDCRMEAKLIVKWKPGRVLAKALGYFHRPAEILRGCTMKVATRNKMPAMKVENVDGIMTITNGVEGKMLLVVAQVLGMKVQVELIQTNRSALVPIEQRILNEVASGRVDIGIGQVRLSTRLNTSNVNFCSTSRFETVVWCVPRIMFYSENITTFEFSRPIWILLSVVGVVMACALFIYRRVSRKNLEMERQRQNRRDVLITRETLRNRDKSTIRKKPIGWGKIILEVFSMSLGYPVFVDPITTSARILLLTFFYYVMVLTTAYKSSLSSAMTVGIDKPLITDVNGIIAVNLTTGGDIRELGVLKDQVDATPANRELIRRYVIYPNQTEAMNRIESRRDIAYLDLLSHLQYEEGIGRMRDNADYYILPDPVLTYNSMIVIEKQSAIQDPLRTNILRLSASGIIGFWQSLANNLKNRQPIPDKDAHDDRRRKRESHYKFEPIFISWAIGMFASLLLFLAELVVHKCW